MIDQFAPAKINLSLHVTGRRDDGYHVLDSLVVFADIGDKITVAPSDTLSLSVSGPFAKGVPTDDSNLVIKAARLLSPDHKAHIALTKNLPHGAGIGGGSSDAAATIRALSELWDIPLPTAAQTLSLGADVPVCMHAPTPMLMSGIGEVLQRAPPTHGGHLVLVNPGVVLPTAKVFARLAEAYGLTDAPMAQMDAFASASDFEGFRTWLLAQRNDLTKCAREFAPEIGQILDLFQDDQDCLKQDMSGSGSTCWGLFETAKSADTAAQKISAAQPNWWVRAAKILA